MINAGVFNGNLIIVRQQNENKPIVRLDIKLSNLNDGELFVTIFRMYFLTTQDGIFFEIIEILLM